MGGKRIGSYSAVKTVSGKNRGIDSPGVRNVRGGADGERKE